MCDVCGCGDPNVVSEELRERILSENDAVRLRRAGIPAHTITTGTACHLDAAMVHEALHHAADAELDVFVIENVGNLVCPAVYDLGQAVNVVALSVTEGVDKPLKYPVMFRAADLVVLTKTDLLPHLPEVDPERIRDALARVMPTPRMLTVSATTGEGMDAWARWLQEATGFHHAPGRRSSERDVGRVVPSRLGS